MSLFDEVYARLRTIMLEQAPDMLVAKDEPGDLVVKTPVIDPRTGQAGWFGTVTVKKSYVAYHLIPLYERPALADELSVALARRRQGKTCFNFKHVDEGLFAELGALTRRAAAL